MFCMKWWLWPIIKVLMTALQNLHNIKEFLVTFMENEILCKVCYDSELAVS